MADTDHRPDRWPLEGLTRQQATERLAGPDLVAALAKAVADEKAPLPPLRAIFPNTEKDPQAAAVAAYKAARRKVVSAARAAYMAPLEKAWRAGRLVAKGYRAPANATTPLQLIPPPGSSWEMIHDRHGDVERSVIRDSRSTRFDNVRFFAVDAVASPPPVDNSAKTDLQSQPPPADYGPVLNHVVDAIKALPGWETTQKGRPPCDVAKDIGHSWINTKRAMKGLHLWVPKPRRK